MTRTRRLPLLGCALFVTLAACATDRDREAPKSPQETAQAPAAAADSSASPAVAVGVPGAPAAAADSRLAKDAARRAADAAPAEPVASALSVQPQAIGVALDWLSNHQAPDGHWDCAGFTAQCKDPSCAGAGSSTNDIGVTGLALLCFLGAGETHDHGTHALTLKKGLNYLRSVQDSDGCYGKRIGQHFMYNHACAALAMTEAYGMTNNNVFKEPAQQGINFILRAQNPYSAWRYAFPPDGDNDTSVTGWMIMALKSAQLSSLTVDKNAFQSAMNWITDVTDPVTGRTGYSERGSSPSRLTETMLKFPAERSESMTAVGMVVRCFAQSDVRSKDPMLDKGAQLLVSMLPTWNTASGDIDFYYWYFGTLAMLQVGGERWDKWRTALETASGGHQRSDKSQCAAGSWDALDPWSTSGGRIYATALNCLSLETCQRYKDVRK